MQLLHYYSIVELQKKIPELLVGQRNDNTALSCMNQILRRELQQKKIVDSIQIKIKNASAFTIIASKENIKYIFEVFKESLETNLKEVVV